MEPQQVPGGEAMSLPPYLVIAHCGHNILYPRAGGTPYPVDGDADWNGRFSAEPWPVVVDTWGRRNLWCVLLPGAWRSGELRYNSGARPRSSGGGRGCRCPCPPANPRPMGPGGGSGAMGPRLRPAGFARAPRRSPGSGRIRNLVGSRARPVAAPPRPGARADYATLGP